MGPHHRHNTSRRSFLWGAGAVGTTRDDGAETIDAFRASAPTVRTSFDAVSAVRCNPVSSAVGRPARRRRRAMYASAVWALALASCAGTDTTTPVDVVITATREPATTTTAIPAAEVATPPAEAAFPITLDSALGPVVIESEPERIIATGSQVDLDSLVALGIDPVAAGTFFGSVAPWQAEALGDSLLFDVNELSVEVLAALEPDLVIGPLDEIEPVRDVLAQLAPVLAVDTGLPWQDNFTLIAAAVGRSDVATRYLADLETLVAEQRALDDGTGQPSLSAFTVSPIGEVLTLGRRSAIGEAAMLLGIARVDGQDIDEEFTALSAERVGELEGDVVAVYVSPFLEAQYDEFRAGPLFASLPAVTEGRVVELSDAHWFFATPITVRLAVERMSSDVIAPVRG
jgi:iron complex transport system substrate-binding protein